VLLDVQTQPTNVEIGGSSAPECSGDGSRFPMPLAAKRVGQHSGLLRRRTRKAQSSLQSELPWSEYSLRGLLCHHEGSVGVVAVAPARGPR
jgi:hypothetical protein